MREWTSSMLLWAFGLLDCFLARAAPGFFGILLSFPLVICVGMCITSLCLKQSNDQRPLLLLAYESMVASTSLYLPSASPRHLKSITWLYEPSLCTG